VLTLISSASPVVTLVKASDQGVTSSTSLIDESHLQHSVGANETWVLTYTLHATFSATGQVKIACVVPSGSTMLLVASMTPNGIVPAFGTTTTSGSGVSLVAALATSGVIIATVTVRTGDEPGTVKLQFAQNSTSVTATEIKANSSLISRRL
jgi:hypothetical protein